jgi:YVTN family beta-propeller protein
MKKCRSIILLSSLIFLFVKPVHADPITRYGSLVVDSVSGRIFAGRQNNAGIDVIKMETGEVITILRDKPIITMALDEKDRILAAIDRDNYFHIISTEAFNILATIPVEGEATSLAIDQEAGLAVFTLAEGKAGFIDLDKYAPLSEIEIPDKPVSVEVDPQLRVAVVVHNTWGNGNDVGGRANDSGRDNVTIIDLTARAIIKTLRAGKNPVETAVNSITHEAAVANEKSNDLTLIDLTTGSVEETIEVGKHPNSLSYNECLNRLSVAGGEDKGWIQVIDINTDENNALYDIDDKPEIIKVNQYLNKAVISGKGGLTTTDLPDPAPQLISIKPEKALRGEESFGFLLEGRGLLEITGVYLNGNETGSTFNGCGAINVSVPGEYLQNTGEIEIAAKNPLPGGGTSNPVYLRIDNPVPTITALDPMEIAAGALGLLITAYGTGFFDDTSVYIDSVSRSFTLGGRTSFQIELGSKDLESGRYLEMTTSNPPPGGGFSGPEVFTVINPVPELAAVEPSTIIAGTRAFDLTLTGGNFVKTSIVSLNNKQYPVKYVSSTQAKATIPEDAVKISGNYTVKVINPPPGGGETQTHILTVKPPIEVKITSPLDGETINSAETLVKGTIKSDTDDVGVLVNGIPAEIRGKEWVANGVPLSIGENTITAAIHDGSGNSANASITINTADTTESLRLFVNITSGVAPLTTRFSLATSIPNPVANYQIDFDGDGVIDYTGETFENVSHTYTTEGFFYPTIIVKDDEGHTYSDTIVLTVMDKVLLDSLLKAKWEALKAALSEKDTEKALGYFVDRSKDRYGRIFDALKDKLPAIMDTFVEFNITDYYDGIAEYEIVADEDGVLYSYPGLLVRDGSGIWKFRDF